MYKSYIYKILFAAGFASQATETVLMHPARYNSRKPVDAVFYTDGYHLSSKILKYRSLDFGVLCGVNRQAWV